MNRAAWASRFFFLVALVPTVVAASFAAYKFHTQPPAPPPRQGGPFSPQIMAKVQQHGLWLGTVAPASSARGPLASVPRRVPHRVAGLYGFETMIGRRATLSAIYVAWRPKTIFPATYTINAAALGAESMIELVPNATKTNPTPTMAQIAAGGDDVTDALQTFAQGALAPHDRFIFSFAPEMNGSWWSYGVQKGDTNPQRNCKDNGYTYRPGDSPNDYVNAFRFVHDFLFSYFAVHHSSRLIKFMWQPSAIHKNTLCPIPWWPGKRYVNEIGLDGYFYYPQDTFNFVFGRTLAYLQKTAPRAHIMIAETAVGQTVGSSRVSADVLSLFTGVSHYRLDGLIWYDGKKVPPPGVPISIAYQDYRLKPGTPTATAFLDGLAHWGHIGSFSKTYMIAGGSPLIPLH